MSKNWLVPANPKYFDIEHAFDGVEEIQWKQGRSIKDGDIVYIYAAKPVQAILYKCRVLKTWTPYHYRKDKLNRLVEDLEKCKD
ncbi:EVE domain-containing protein [Candidatus Saccharibacteria bacterium]|nr:EVE domain-containing protein [Candidatus Saccharibacteria bacterium]